MRGIIRRRLAASRGQTIAMFVMSIICLLGMAALTIDVGVWYLTKQRLQDAADHAALAGASALPNIDSAAALALSQGHKNMRDATFVVTTPYKGSANKFRVQGSTRAPLFFAQLFGIGDLMIHTDSVAEAHPGTGSAAVFANETTCGEGHGLLVRVNSFTSTGTIHTNGMMDTQWSGAHGLITYGGPNNCTPIGSTSGGSVDRSLWPWPDWHATSDFHCDFTAVSFNLTGPTIPTGTYCAKNANGSITAANTIRVNTGASGKVTLVGWQVSISDHNMTLTPNELNVLAMAVGNITAGGTGAIDVNGNNMSLTGTLFAPNGRVIINGNTGVTLTAFLEGLMVELDGNNWALTGSGSQALGQAPTLVE
jgi:hypothetical protein